MTITTAPATAESRTDNTVPDWGDLTDLIPNVAASTAALRVLRPDGSIAKFDARRIAVAITRAFLAADVSCAGHAARLRTVVGELTDSVVTPLGRRYGDVSRAALRPIPVEQVRDQVELELMRRGHAAVARAYRR